MLLRPKYAGDSYSKRELFLTLLIWVLILAGLGYALGWWGRYAHRWQCGAERVQLLSRDTFFVTEGTRFSGGGGQSDRFAVTGRHSLRLDGRRPYGFGLQLYDIDPSDRLRATVWRYAPEGSYAPAGVLVAAMKGTDLYEVGERIIERRADGWEQLELRLPKLPPRRFATLSIYCWNSQPTPLYFDDLEVVRTTSTD